MVKHLITEITEEDFRKLNLKGKVYRRIRLHDGTHVNKWKEVDLNERLTENIEYLIEQGYESDQEDLNIPFTIAIHEENDRSLEELDNKTFFFGYWDKFMNRFDGPATYEIGIGIKHLYSTRDYYECKEDYWRVRKDQTKVIYRIRISQKWKDKFILKHKTIIEDVDPEKFKEDIEHGLDVKLHKKYDLVNGEFVLKGRVIIKRSKYSSMHIPVDENLLPINKSVEEHYDEKEY